MSSILKSNIFRGAETGDVQFIKICLTLSGTYGEISDFQEIISSPHCGTTPLLIASRNGHASVVQYLVENWHADVEQVGSICIDNEQYYDVSPLWCAAAAGQFQVVKLLVSYNANINCSSESQSTPLRAACFDGHLEITKFLVENGADIELANSHNHTCLMIASFRGHIDIVRFLLDCGANINRKSSEGNTALHDAAETNNIEILKILLQHGAVMQHDYRGMSPILSAALEAQEDVVEYLLDSGLCTLQDMISAVELLGAAYLDKKENMRKALHYWELGFSLRSKDAELFLPKSGYDSSLNKYIPATEAKTLNELHLISKNSNAIKFHSLLLRERILGPTHPAIIPHIIMRGSKYIDVGDVYHCMELWLYAVDIQLNKFEPCNMPATSVLALFLDICCAKLKKSRVNSIKNSVFEFESWVKFFSIAINEVKKSMENIGKQKKYTENFLDCLMFCILNGIALFTTEMGCYSVQQIERLKSLLRMFISLNPLGPNKKTMLHMACLGSVFDILQPLSMFPNPNVLKFLVEAGAFLDALDGDFNTPLHEAARSVTDSQAVLFKTLLELGAHYDIKNKYGLIPVELMTDIKKKEICPLQYTSLQCLCACSIKKQKIRYNMLPGILEKFIDLH